MGDFVGLLTNCFIMGDKISSYPDGSSRHDRINLSFAGFDLTLLQRREYFGGSLSKYRGQTHATTEVHVKDLPPDRFDDLIEKLKGLANLLSFATVSGVSLCAWEYPDHNPSGQGETVLSRVGYFRPVIDTMEGETVRDFLQQTWTKYFSEATRRNLPVAMGYFVTAETHDLPMELELVCMFILFENLKATFAAASGYPYKDGCYRRANGGPWSFRDLLKEMFGAVGMTPPLDDLVGLRNEVIHSGISQLPLDRQMEIYSQLQNICREYFVRLLGYTGPYHNYSGRGAEVVRAV